LLRREGWVRNRKRTYRLYTALGLQVRTKRRRTLEVSLPRRTTGEPLHVVVDITGIKVFGEGEWKVRSHGWAKRRTWRKLHIGVDEVSSEIVAAAVTIFDFSDGQLLPDLLDQVGENIAQVSGDGAYAMREWLKRRFTSGKTSGHPCVMRRTYLAAWPLKRPAIGSR
jgi:hypothetical protein